jgi:hypothetical protein
MQGLLQHSLVTRIDTQADSDLIAQLTADSSGMEERYALIPMFAEARFNVVHRLLLTPRGRDTPERSTVFGVEARRDRAGGDSPPSAC